MKKNIKVSVILNTLNSPANLSTGIEGLMNQSLYRAGQMEIMTVLYNDDPFELSGQFENLNLIRVDKKLNKSELINYCINDSKGDYLFYLDSSDSLAANALEKMFNVFDNFAPIDVVYTDLYETMTENDSIDSASVKRKVEWINFERDLLLFGCFVGPFTMWKKSLHDKYGYFDENLKFNGDYSFWLKISKSAQFYHIAEPLGLALYNKEIKNKQDVQFAENEAERIRKKYFLEYVKDHNDLNKVKTKFEFISDRFQEKDYAQNGSELIKFRSVGIDLEEKIKSLVNSFEETPVNAVFEAVSSYLTDLKSEQVLTDINYLAGILYALKGSCYLMSNQASEAKKMFEIATEYDPSNAEYFNKHKIISEIPEKIEKDPVVLDQKHFISVLTSAAEHIKSDHYDESLEVLVNLEKSYGESHNSDSLKLKISEIKEMMGYCNLGIGDYEAAHECFKNALEYNPESTYACAGLGKLFLLIGEDDLSKTMFEWAVKNDKNNKFAIKGLKQVNEKLGYTDEHSSLTEGYVSPKVEEAEALIQQGQFEGAEEMLQGILNYDPEHIAALNDLSVIKIMQKDYHTAASLILKVVNIDPQNDVAADNLEVLEELVNSTTENVNLSVAEA